MKKQIHGNKKQKKKATKAQVYRAYSQKANYIAA